MGTTLSTPAYSERLRAPLGWWLAGAAFVATVWLVLSVVSSSLFLAVGVAIAAVLVTGALTLAGRLQVGVQGAEVVAGRAHVPLSLCAAVEPLDDVTTRRLRGVDADARAFLVLRPWLPCAVRVVLDDPGDPTPYWLVSTRDPQAFAAAATAGLPNDAETPGSAGVPGVGHDEPGRTGAP